MALAKVNSAAVLGLEGQLVEVQVDIASGLPATTIVGLPDTGDGDQNNSVRRLARGRRRPGREFLNRCQKRQAQ